MTLDRKLITAIMAAVALVLGTATAAGALPWKPLCALPMAAPGCKAVETGQAIDRKADAVVDAGSTAYGTAESAGSLAVNGTKLAGTVLDKASQATAWANDAVAQLPVPTRSLRPGECVETTNGRYCLPAAGGRPHPSVTPPPAAACVLDRSGRRWCVVR